MKPPGGNLRSGTGLDDLPLSRDEHAIDAIWRETARFTDDLADQLAITTLIVQAGRGHEAKSIIDNAIARKVPMPVCNCPSYYDKESWPLADFCPVHGES